MNTVQINCFLTAAKVMSFTKAAKLLYISQPALSKQISALERELNMNLFIRDHNSVRLTPAGMVLLDELPGLMAAYDEIVERAGVINAGYASALTIGTLESQWVSPRFSRAFTRFNQQYANVSVKLVQDSFSGLRERLVTGDIDFAITLDFDIPPEGDFQWVTLERGEAFLIISKSQSIASRSKIGLGDLENVPFILISPEDSERGAGLMLQELERSGIRPVIRYAPNLSTVMLWVEAGMGVGLASSTSPSISSQNIRVIDELTFGPADLCLAWHTGSKNPAVPLFIQFIQGDEAGD